MGWRVSQSIAPSWRQLFFGAWFTSGLWLCSEAYAQVDLLNQPGVSAEQRRAYWQQQQTVEDNEPISTPPLPELAVPPPASEALEPLDIRASDLNQGLKSVGAPYPEGKSVPAQAWQDTAPNALTPLPLPMIAPLHLAWRDLLLSEAYMPATLSEASFLGYRLESLLRLGLVHDSHRLAQQAGLYDNVLVVNDQRLAPLVTTALLRQDWARLCPLVQEQIQGKNTPAYTRLGIVCFLLDNEQSQARLQLQLLRERWGREAVDDGFSLLVNMILLQTTILPTGAEIALLPDNLMLALLGNISIHTDNNAATALRKADGITSYALLQQDSATLEQRLLWAEIALQRGVISLREMTNIQRALSFEAQEYENSAALITQAYAPRTRALVVQQLAQGTLDDSAAMALMEQALQAADQADDFVLMLHILAPFKHRLSALEANQILLRRAALAWDVPLVIRPTPDNTMLPQAQGKTPAQSAQDEIQRAVIALLDQWQDVAPTPDTINDVLGTAINRDFLTNLIHDQAADNTAALPVEQRQMLEDTLEHIGQWGEALAPLRALPSDLLTNKPKQNHYASALRLVGQALVAADEKSSIFDGAKSSNLSGSSELASDLAQALVLLAQHDHTLSRQLAAWVLASKLTIPDFSTPTAPELPSDTPP